jgi:putative DNA methylase
MEFKKKLIEVSLPLDAINAASVREKSLRHGHPSSLHLWWARRPLAAARAVIWSSLVDDPSSHPEEFPTEEEQAKERYRLFSILEKLVKWENSNNLNVLAEAKNEIIKSTGGIQPDFLDPFAGGGAIPLEAQRLGLVSHASDLNPVAVMINKAMIEIPSKFAGHAPVNPKSYKISGTWMGSDGLAADVGYYGELLKQKVFEEIGYLYPKIKDDQGDDHTVIAWIWARTVKCPNPICGCEMPLANSFVLSKKRGNEAYIEPVVNHNNITYVVKHGTTPTESPKLARGAKFKCVCCGEATKSDYIKAEGVAGRMGSVLMAIVAEGPRGRLYFSPNDEHISIARVDKPDEYPTQKIGYDPRSIWCPSYGLDTFDKLFTNRQLTTLTTFSSIISKIQALIEKDGGSQEYAQAIIVYLAFLVDQLANRTSILCGWDISCEKLRSVFARQGLSMTWDYAENNPFCVSSGSYNNFLVRLVKGLAEIKNNIMGYANQTDVRTDNFLRNVMISTDPPYYDNISYSVISDYFYIWLRQIVKKIYPDIFQTILTPKDEELVASQYRFGGNVEKAQKFFEDGMLSAFKMINLYAREDIPVTVYYAFKQNEYEDDGKKASSGWETMLSAIIQAGFAITGTWPIRTEMPNRSLGLSANALASSIVLVCRKRIDDAPISTRRDFINALKRELKPALTKLQNSNIAPVDLAQSAIGPGMSVYSQFSKVLDADGAEMSVRAALQIINQELDLYFTDQDGELDLDSRFCFELYAQYGLGEFKYGEAEILARAKNTSVDKLVNRGIIFAQKGIARLLTREEIKGEVNHQENIIWLLAQQLTRVLEKDGVSGASKIVSEINSSAPEQAKSLAYRLYTIAERNNWANEAFAYNSLVIAWPEIKISMTNLRSRKGSDSVRYNINFDNNKLGG